MIAFILGMICGFALCALVVALRVVLNPEDKRNTSDEEWQEFHKWYSESRGLNYERPRDKGIH